MMMMSAFVAVPTYNVGADEHEGGDGDGEEFIVNDGENPDCYKNWMDNGQPVWSSSWPHYDKNITVEWEAGTGELWYPEGGGIVQNEEPGLGHWWPCKSDYGGGFDDDYHEVDPGEFHVILEMIDLENWELSLSAEYNKTATKHLRALYAEHCEHIGITDDSSEVTKDCFEYMEYMENSDYDCHSTDIEKCKEMENCDTRSDDFFNIECMKRLYDACSDDSDFHYDCKDDDIEPFFKLFDYEENKITSKEWADYIAEVIDEENNDENNDEDDWYEIATYSTDSLTIDQQGRYVISFETPYNYVDNPNFICGNGSEIPFSWVNDGTEHCSDGADEQQYDEFGDRINWFDCHDGSDVWIEQVNNGVADCSDGEDEKFEDWHMHADAFLYQGSHSDIDGTSIDNLISTSGYNCYWADESDKTAGKYCDNTIDVILDVGDYTLVAASRCPTEYDDSTDQYDHICNGEEQWSRNYGQYNYTILFPNGEWNYIDGYIDHDAEEEGETMYLTEDHYDARDESKSNFVLYTEHDISFSSDFEGTIMAKSTRCESFDESTGEYEDCTGSYSIATYLYEGAFNSSNPLENLLYSNDYHYPKTYWGRDYDKCCFTMLDVSLDSGDYTVVTTTDNIWMDGKSDYSYSYEISNDESEFPTTEWKGSFNDVFERAYMPYAWKHDPQNGYDWDGTIEEHIGGIEHTAKEYSNDNITHQEAAPILANKLRAYIEAVEEIQEENEDDFTGDNECPFRHMDCYEMQKICVSDSNDYDPERCAVNLYEHCSDTHDKGCDNFAEACANGNVDDEVCDKYSEEVKDDSLSLDGIYSHVYFKPVNAGVIGKVEDNNENAYLTSTEKITFVDVDETLLTHTLVLPGNGDDDEEEEEEFPMSEWEEEEPPVHVTVKLAEGYQIDSCEGCATPLGDGVNTEVEFIIDEDSDQVSITFSKSEPLPECDVTIGVDDANYAFDPVSVEIEFGQTVCWKWKETVEPHNVAQVAESSDTTKQSTGFYSGEATNVSDFRVTFDAANGYSDDTTYYYICEPHVTMKMVGEIIVGSGSTDEELEDAIEESGLPSVSFIVGIIVLVGAAGLRRRIH